MGIILNKGQRRVVDEAVHFYKHSSQQVYQYSGPAGSGKSTIAHAIINELQIPMHRVAAMTFTGAASIILRLRGFRSAKTIHSTLLSPVQDYKIDKQGNIVTDGYFDRPEFELMFEPKPLTDIDLMYIDEGGMVPYELKQEIESRGIKIIVCGDINQLPPPCDRPAYLYEGEVTFLDEIMRQNEGSALLYLADRALKGLPINQGFYGDCLVIYEDELTDLMIQKSDIVLCGKNVTRDAINKHVRHDILGFNTDIPMFGERVICRKNNWSIETEGINLTNGLMGTVVNQPGVESFDGKTFKIDFHPNLINSDFRALAIDYEYFVAPHERKKYIKNNKYSRGEKFEFAYGITTHLSQGNEFNFGIYMQEFLGKDIQRNLDYTAITRFKQGMIFVKKRRKFY